jgi:glycoside/pentoside/hexuronide:cation symporter, GPH family
MNRQDISRPASDPISLFRIFAYVLPAVPLAALGMPIVVHLPQFYASKEIGLDFVVTGLIFMAMRIFDVVVDPVMGYWSDRWRTPFGRRKPLILIGAPLLALGIWMVFVPGGHVGAFYLCFWLFVMYVGWSMTTIPHLSWGAELSSDYHRRSLIYGLSQLGTLVGFIGVLVLPAFLEHGKASQAVQVMSMAAFAIVLLVPSVALCLGVVPEPEVKLRTHAPLLPTLRFLLRNDAVRRVMLVDLIESTNQGARGAMFFFFMRLALGEPKWAGTLLLLYFVAGIVFIPGWIALSRRIGKHRALICCYVYGILAGPLLFTIRPGDLRQTIIVLLVTGVTYGAPAFLLRSMMADVADADTAENGTERAGLMYSFLSLTSKFGIGAAVGITFPILALMGFDPKVVNPPAAIENLRVFYILLPIGLAFLSLFVMLGYRLDEGRQRILRAEIERRRQMHQSADDILPPGILPGGAALASDSEAVTKLVGDGQARSRT